MCGISAIFSRIFTFNVIANLFSKLNGILDFVWNLFKQRQLKLCCNSTLDSVVIDQKYPEGSPITNRAQGSRKMGIPNNCDNPKKSMEMWYICRFLSPKQDQFLVSERQMDNAEGEVKLERKIVELDEDENEIVSEDDSKETEENENMEAITENGLAEQLVMVQEMVHDIKEGFEGVMTELSHSQTTEKNNWRQVSETQDSQQEQINQLQTTVTSLKTEFVGQMKNVSNIQVEFEERIKTVEAERDGLLDKLDTLQKQYDCLLHELVRCGSLPDTVRSQIMNGNLQFHVLHTSPWQDKNTSHSAHGMKDGINGDTDVTSIACKSLSLSQALKEKCMNLNLSESSDEDPPIPWQQSVDGRSSSGKSRGYHSPRKMSPVDGSDTGPRLQAIEELIQSEKDYCSQLWMILDDYLAPLQERHYLSAREISVLIPPYVGQIYDHHCQILSTLQERVGYWGWNVSIGDIFSRMTDSEEENIMSVYREYIADIPAAVGCLRRHIVQSRNFKAFIKAQKSNAGASDILTLMMAPLQRIPRYSLLLQQVLKYTSVNHPDHYNLQTSLVKLKSFVDQFNSEMSHTMMALNSDHPRRSGQSFRSSASGSSYDAGHVPSTRDSGIHSNSDTNHRSSRLPDNLDRGNFLPDWIEQSTGYLDQANGMSREVYRDAHRMKLAARSQPDLTSYNKTYGRHNHHGDNSHQRNVDSLSSLHHTENKFKRPRSRRLDMSDGLLVNKRPVSMSQTQVNSLRDLSYSNSPRGRPASAIDFMGQGGADTPRQRSHREHLLNRPHTSLGPMTRVYNTPNLKIPNDQRYAQNNFSGDNYKDYGGRQISNGYGNHEQMQNHMTRHGNVERLQERHEENGGDVDRNSDNYYHNMSEKYHEETSQEYPSINGVSQYHADIEDEDDTAVHSTENLNNVKGIHDGSNEELDYQQVQDYHLQQGNNHLNVYNNSERAASDISQDDIDNSVTRSLRLEDVTAHPVLNSTVHDIDDQTTFLQPAPPPLSTHSHHASHTNITDLENSEHRLMDSTHAGIKHQSQSICIPEELASSQKNLDSKKKKKPTKRYTSLEHIPMADDESQARRRQTIKSSLKSLFSKKKGSIRIDELEAEFAKEQRRTQNIKSNKLSPNGITMVQTSDNSRLAAIKNLRPQLFSSFFQRDQQNGCVNA